MMGMNKRKDITKELLQELYINKGMSASKISKQLKSSKVTITRRLRRYGFNVKDKLEAQIEATSKENNWQWNKELTNICKNCNKLYRKRDLNKADFCSHPCYWESKRENLSANHKNFLLSSNWIKKAKEIRNRDEYECRICGITNEKQIKKYGKSLHVHHIIPRKIRPDLKLNNYNLITLCSECHPKQERGRQVVFVVMI